MDIRIEGSADFRSVINQVRALHTQVDALNSELAKTGIVSQGAALNPRGYSQMQGAMRASSRTYRDAAASSGKFYTEQIKVNSATQHYTDLLRKQKLSMVDLWKNRDVMRKAYKEQIALQNMYIREAPSMTSGGKKLYDVATPRQMSKDLDTVGNKLGWLKAQLASASTQMVNWGKNTQWAGRQLMVGFTIPVAAFGAATGVLAYQVDKELTRVMKVYDTTAQAVAGDAGSMAAVNKELAEVVKASWQSAEQAAREYGASAKDTLNVQAGLAATGKTGAALQSATTETIRIATLGELDYQMALDSTIALQSAFRLSTEELTEAFNFMNATENATSLSIKDIAEAVPRAASAMSALKVSVEEMTVMLTSMRESGVDAAEAANALKSATGTILAPSPAADEFIKQISGGRVEVMKLAEASGGNLYKAMEILFQSMEGLSKLQKQQILVKLFGKYQFNRVSAMLYNMGDAFTGVENQTSKAMELMGKSTEELAHTADIELKRFQDSTSGRFKTTLETLKVELAQMGAPFLEVATWTLKVVTGFAEFFNGMPGWAKKVAMFGAIFMALMGPLVMLVGLAANFAGNFIKFGASAVFLANKFDLVTKESKAMELASKVAAAGFDTEARSVALLTEQIQILTAAQIESQKTAMDFIHGPSPVTPAASPVPLGNAPLPANPYNSGGKPMGSGVGGWNANPMAGYIPIPAPINPYAEANKGAAVQAEIVDDIAETQDDILTNATDETNQRKETSKHMRAAQVSGALMLGSMTAMMIAGDGLVNDIAQVALVGAMIVPLFSMLGGGLKNAALKMQEIHAATKATAIAQNANAAASSRAAAASTVQAGALARAAVAGKAGLAAIVGLMGPIGWTLTAITAIGGAMWLWSKHQKEIYEDAVKAQETLDSTAERWAEGLGKVAGEYEKIQLINAEIAQTKGFEAVLDSYQSGDQKETADKFNALAENEQAQRAMEMYIDFQIKAGMSADKAAQQITALYIATGTAADDATAKAKALVEEFGNIKKTGNWQPIIQNAGFQLLGNTDEFFAGQGTDIIRANATKMAEVWSAGFSTAAKPKAAKDMFGQLERTALDEWENVLAELESSTGGQKFLKDFGINSAQELSRYFESAKHPIDDLAQYMDTVTAGSLEASMMNAQGLEKEVIQAVAAYMGLGDEIVTAWQLQNEMNIAAQMLSYKDAVKSAKELVAELNKAAITSRIFNDMNVDNVLFGDYFDNKAAREEADTKARINAMNAAQGYKEGATASQALANLLGRVKDETGGAADEARNLKGELDGASRAFKGDDYVSVLRSAMEGLKDEMASDASDAFERRMDSSLDASQEMWDNRIEAQERAFDNAQEAFDRRWELRKEQVENYYDKRAEKVQDAIEAEQKAEDIRKRIFEAEMTRLDRMNEAQNRNIDFNAALNAGDFDTAAKIRNDAAAAYNEWMVQDESEKATRRSENRQERLEDRAERIEERKEKALKALEDREEAERKHMDRMQEIRKDGLRERAEDEMDAAKASWELEKEAFEAKLDLFKALPAANQKQLLKALKESGLTLRDFGVDTLDPTSEKWGKYFKTALQKHVKEAGANIASDKMWENMAGKQAKAILESFGFENMGQLSRFIKTGKMPNKRPSTILEPKLSLPANHSGGIVGDGGSGRKGVARTLRGVHSSEQLILAQKGEGIIPRDVMRGFGGDLGPAGLQGAMNYSMLMAGTSSAIARAFLKGSHGPGSGPTASYVSGRGGWQKPAPPGYGWFNTHDYSTPIGTPLFAVNDGQVIESRAITSGGSAGNGLYSTPYRSYGETVVIRTGDGDFRYAHMNPGTRIGLGPIKGGTQIGESGNTGNSSGPHVHMDIDGDYNASGWLARHGIHLSKGAANINYDNTIANLHKGEAVLTKDMNSQFKEGMARFSKGPVGTLESVFNKWGLSLQVQKKKNETPDDKAGNLRTGTYNLNNNSGPATRADLERLMEKADVLGLTDVSNDKVIKEWLNSKGWGMHGAGDSAVIWNKKMYEFLKGSAEVLNKTTEHPNRSGYKAMASYAKLRGKDGGNSFWAAAAHTIAHTGWMKGTDAVQAEQFQTLTNLNKRLTSDGSPMVLMGDFNEDLRADSINIKGMKSNWMGNMKKGGGTLGNRYIDHILASLGLQLVGTQLVGNTASNHNAALAQYNIPGLSKGAENIRFNNTIANLHKGESVLTKDISSQFRKGVDNFANGGGNVYNLTVNANGENLSAKDIARLAVKELQLLEARKPGSRSK